MKRMCSLIIGGLMLASVSGVDRPSTSGQVTPKWRVGDSWRVGTWHGQVFRPDKRPTRGTYKFRGQMITATFQVTGAQSIGDTECHQVQVTFPTEETGFQRRYRAWYCRTTGRLLRVKDVSLRPDGTTKDITMDYPADAQGPTFVDNMPSPLPLDWPNLARENVVPPPDEAGVVVQATIPGTTESPDGAVQPQDEVMLTRSCPGKQAKVVQHWREREPWWREARKYENGQLVAEAILLEVNGRRVAEGP